MAAALFDTEALTKLFENATAEQGAQLKRAATEATLAGLRGRELTLKNIRAAMQAVSAAASTGAARNLVGLDPELLLAQAMDGIDQALLKAVDAHHLALKQLQAQGADLQDKHLKTAITELEKLEDTFFATMKKVAGDAEGHMASAWVPVLEKFRVGGSQVGAQAHQTLADLTDQVQHSLRQQRAAGLRAAQAMAESYTAMVSGVLLGMAEAMSTAAPAPRKKG